MAKAITGRKSSRLPALDAIQVRDADALIAKLLNELQISLLAVNSQLLNKVTDLKQVLATDYREVPGMPANPLVKELSRIIELDIKPHFNGMSDSWNNEHLLRHLEETYGPHEIEVRAEPYRRGSGLALRGFFCRAEVSQKSKFLIFLNSAHPPAVVAATAGHELGHYIYGSLVGENSTFNAFIEGCFARHLADESELFADCMVALSAYDHQTLQRISAIDGSLHPDGWIGLFKEIHHMVDSRFELKLSPKRLATVCRVSYVTAMIHFFKLRRAVFQRTGI